MIPRHLQIAFVLLLAGVFGVGGYMLHLKNRAGENTADVRPVAPPVTTPAEPLTLYVAYDDEGVLLKRSAMAPLPSEPTARAQEILRTLLAEYLDNHSPHPIGPGSDVREVFLVNNNLAVVDLNQAFAEGHRSGVWEESLTIDSMVATLAAGMPSITQVKFLVDGQEHETLAGHADLMSVYRVADVNRLIQDLR
jgi:spore germination protein GerM